MSQERTPLLSQPPTPPPSDRPPPAVAEAHGPDEPNFNLARWYIKALHDKPLLTKVATSALISAVSDLIAQAVERNAELDVMRNCAFFLSGALLTAPMFHMAYELFEHVIPATTATNVMLQVLADQLLVAPLWLLLFLPFVACVEGERHTRALADTLRRQFVPALKVTWVVFPAVQVANFSLVPKPLRVLVVNVCDLVYTTILSWLAHGHERHTAHS